MGLEVRVPWAGKAAAPGAAGVPTGTDFDPEHRTSLVNKNLLEEKTGRIFFKH